MERWVSRGASPAARTALAALDVSKVECRGALAVGLSKEQWVRELSAS
jgi:hypothetical protein